MKTFHYRTMVLSGLLAILAPIGTAHAQEQAAQEPAAAAPQPPDCLKYDSIRPRGSTTPWPPNCATFSPDLGGLRETLFDHGWNVRGYLTLINSLYDIRNKNGNDLQTYPGQKPLLGTALWVSSLYDLSRLGFNPGATFIFDVSSAASTWHDFAPSKTYINELSIFTPFSNDRAELKLGFVRAANEFYGQTSGTSLGASALRLESAITVQAGLTTIEPAPYLGLTVYDKDHRFYSKSAVAQSMSPDGLIANSDLKHDLFTRIPGAKAVYVTELGYRGRYDLGEKAHWFRAGAIYNTSQYRLYDGSGRKDRNYALYSQADIQLTHDSSLSPLLGWYMNLRANYAPPDRNVYNGDVGLSFYKIGTFPSRPADLFSVSIARNWFSKDVRDQFALAGLETEKYQTTYSVSYAYEVKRGLYLNVGLSHTDHPTLAPKQEAATVASLMLTAAF